jgi:hypothetical protein
MKLLMGPCRALFFQVQPKFITHLKLVWNPVFVMVLLVLGIGLLKNILNMLVDVSDLLNERGRFVDFSLSMG